MKVKKLYLVLIISLVFIGISGTSTFSFNANEDVAIFYDQKNNSFIFTASEMKKNLESSGHKVLLADVSSLSTLKAPNRIILTERGMAEASSFTSLPGSVSQGYSLRKKSVGANADWYVIGFDKRGTINGGLDVSESVRYNGFSSLTDIDKKPYISNRGIKFNIPLDARTPSYSDNADAAQQNIANMWDMNFWHEFLDEMARDRYNMLSLWNESPFPSLVDVPEYPKAALADIKKTTTRLQASTTGLYMSTPQSRANLVILKKMTMAEKIKFWQDVMQYASDRGIDLYLFTWNLFAYGLEDSGYGMTDEMSNAKTKDYIRKATRTLIQTYPLLKGIGLTAGENLRGTEADKEKYLYEAYGEGINDALTADPKRTFKLIHRAHQADIKIIKDTFTGLNSRCEMTYSYKYSVAQMYSSEAPQYIYESKFIENIGDSKFFLTVRDDAWYNLRGGSDASFARNYLKNIPSKGKFEGFYMGPDGYTWGRDYLSKTPDAQRQLVIKKRWYCLQLMGKLAYDPDLTDAYFAKVLGSRFPEVNAQKLQQAWAGSSQIMTWINRFHNQGAQNDFQWYPEACTSFYGFHTIDKFITMGPQTGEGFLSIPIYVDAVMNSKSIEGTTPLQVAQKLSEISNQSLSLISGMTTVKNKELKETLGDIKAMAYLGQYYSNKILAATNKHFFDKFSDAAKKTEYKNIAIKNLENASGSWKLYAAQVSNSYIPQYLTRTHFTVDFQALQANVDKEIIQLKQQFPGTTPAAITTGRVFNPIEASFSSAYNYFFWTQSNLGVAANWTGNKYVVLEVYATTVQKFDFVIQTPTDTLTKEGIQPVANKWIKMAISLDDLKSQFAKKQSNGSVTVDMATLLNEVRGVGFKIGKPVNYPVLQIKAITLVKGEPEGVIILN